MIDYICSDVCNYYREKDLRFQKKKPLSIIYYIIDSVLTVRPRKTAVDRINNGEIKYSRHYSMLSLAKVDLMVRLVFFFKYF